MENPTEVVKKPYLKEKILEFLGLKWWQSFLVGFIIFLFFSLFTNDWRLLFLLGVIIGFLSGENILKSASITSGSLTLAWLLVYILDIFFSGFRTLEAADALLAIATGATGLSVLFIIIALVFAVLLGFTSGAFGSSLFGEWLQVRTRWLSSSQSKKQ